MSFVLTAVVSSFQHYSYYKEAVRDGKIDDSSESRKQYAKEAAKTVAKKAAISGGITAASIATEAAAFHVATNFMPAQKAQMAATIAAAVGVASLDIVEEIIAYRTGAVSGTEATICGGIKAVADAIPIVLQVVAGRAGSAIGLVASAGIKWGLGHVRNELRSPAVAEAA